MALSALIMVSRGKHRAGRLDDGNKGGLGQTASVWGEDIQMLKVVHADGALDGVSLLPTSRGPR